ncbi:hypothetical protein KSD_58120 [Ktedonobacter sp. SOSP1-85]|nr:hypothetical protein KSD_58120 [Ktedonobacter sp. SOSP1-85]
MQSFANVGDNSSQDINQERMDIDSSCLTPNPIQKQLFHTFPRFSLGIAHRGISCYSKDEKRHSSMV